MKVLVVRPGPNFSVEDVATGWESGFAELGVDVRSFPFGDVMSLEERGLRASGTPDSESGQPAATLAAAHLRAACFDYWPDLVVIVSSFFVPPQTYEFIRGRGIKVATLFTESPYEDDNQVLIAAHADVCAVNDPQNLDRFRAANPNTVYLPHAYRPGIHHPRPVKSDDYRSDFCFVGTGYPSRVEFFGACNFDGVDVALAGNWAEHADSPLAKYVAHDIGICIANDEAQELYAGCKASANIYRTEAQRPDLSKGWAMGPREVELAASGTFFLTEPRGENRAVLPMVPTFDGPDDFSDQLRWWLDHPDERADVALQARAAVADRTFKANAQKLLALAGF